MIPEETSVAVVSFPTIRDAASAAAAVMQAAVPVQCMELLDEIQMRVVNLSGFTRPRVWEEQPTLFFKFSGSKPSVQEHIESVKQITSKKNGGPGAAAAVVGEEAVTVVDAGAAERGRRCL